MVPMHCTMYLHVLCTLLGSPGLACGGEVVSVYFVLDYYITTPTIGRIPQGEYSPKV